MMVWHIMSGNDPYSPGVIYGKFYWHALGHTASGCKWRIGPTQSYQSLNHWNLGGGDSYLYTDTPCNSFSRRAHFPALHITLSSIFPMTMRPQVLVLRSPLNCDSSAPYKVFCCCHSNGSHCCSTLSHWQNGWGATPVPIRHGHNNGWKKRERAQSSVTFLS